MISKDHLLEDQANESLDPANWEEMKDLGQRMVSDMASFLQEIGDQPVWKKTPENIKDHFRSPLPQVPQPLEYVYEEFKQFILPYSLGNIHPRFWSWVMGTGSLQGMLAEMLAAGMNCNVGIGDQAPMYVDGQVLNWCKEMMDFPATASGALVNGASTANLNALIVARNSAQDKIRQCGLPAGKKMVFYASTETHSCIQKAAEIIGIGTEGMRQVPVNDNYEIDPLQLEEMITRDKERGWLPFCIVGNIGTVNTGAIDPLDELLSIARKHKLWFHIDGAFGALLKLLPAYKEKLRAIGYADSLAFDLHKWMYMPYEAGVVLVRNAQQHRASFALQPDYILNQERGISAGPEITSNFGIELSRDFKALKVWMLLKENGIDKFRRLIEQNMAQARFLANRIEQSDRLQLMAPVPANIVCFRYNKAGLKPEQLDELNKEILVQLQEKGIAAPSYTKLKGHYCLRAAIVNHRSRQEDFEILTEEVLAIGDQLSEDLEVRDYLPGTSSLEKFY